jgi:hypothetical protein
MKKNRAALFGIIVALTLLGLGSWFLIEKTVDPIGNELALVTPKVMGFNGDDPEDLLTNLLDKNIDEKNIPEITYLVARLLTIERAPGPKNRPPVPPGPAWTAYKEKNNPIIKLRMDQFESTTGWSGLSRYLFELYEQNFGRARDSIEYLITYKAYLPSSSMVIAQALFEKKGIKINFTRGEDQTEKVKASVRELLQGDEFLSWAKSKTYNLRLFAGNANPTLGLYDWIAYPQFAEKVGLNRFRKDADVYLDLGGGYETPEVSRILQHRFVSLDVLPPKSGRNLNLLFFGLDSWIKPSLYPLNVHPLAEKEREAYFAKLDETPFRHFNIYENSLSKKYQSYFITSFNFIGSTVGSNSQKASYMQNNSIPKIFATTYIGVRRIIELAAAGKDVDFFTVMGNPYRLFRFHTAYLSFRNHRLVDEKLMPRDLEGAEGVLKRIRK